MTTVTDTFLVGADLCSYPLCDPSSRTVKYNYWSLCEASFCGNSSAVAAIADVVPDTDSPVGKPYAVSLSYFSSFIFKY